MLGMNGGTPMSIASLRKDALTNLPFYEERVDLACAFRWTVRLNMHEAVANHFSLAVSDDGTKFLMNPNQVLFSRIRDGDLVRLDKYLRARCTVAVMLGQMQRQPAARHAHVQRQIGREAMLPVNREAEIIAIKLPRLLDRERAQKWYRLPELNDHDPEARDPKGQPALTFRAGRIAAMQPADDWLVARAAAPRYGPLWRSSDGARD